MLTFSIQINTLYIPLFSSISQHGFLTRSQFPATMYDAYISTVAEALKDELCTVKLDVLAKSMRQKKDQAEKRVRSVVEVGSGNVGSD